MTEEELLIEDERRNRWLEQGAPVNGPVVVEVGNLFVSPDGHRTISDWGWDTAFMNTITIDQLWDFLVTRYPDRLVKF